MLLGRRVDDWDRADCMSSWRFLCLTCSSLQRQHRGRRTRLRQPTAMWS